MPRYLFIVARDNPTLYEYLKERFAGDDAVEIIIDRRRSGAPATPAVDRRSHPEINDEIRTRSYAVVTLP
jgi:hypothetical protein